jgi:hypothetical protein
VVVARGCVCGMRLAWEGCWLLRSRWGVKVLAFVGSLGVVGDPAGYGMALGDFLWKLLWMAWVWGSSLRV